LGFPLQAMADPIRNEISNGSNGAEQRREPLEKFWQGVLEFWQKMIDWFKNLWYSYVLPWLQNIWQKIDSFLEKEVEKRKPEIKEEFEKEKQEMKEDIPEVSKSLWQRLKELIR